MPLMRIIKDLICGIDTCESMPLHFYLIKSILLHGVKLKEGRYNFVAYDTLENSFVYRSVEHKKVSISLRDFKFLVKSKMVKSYG